jgi:hypothetical protein
MWLFAVAVGFYTTVVLQVLWNWFVVERYRPGHRVLADVRLHMLLGLVLEREKGDGGSVEACVRPHGRQCSGPQEDGGG